MVTDNYLMLDLIAVAALTLVFMLGVLLHGMGTLIDTCRRIENRVDWLERMLNDVECKLSDIRMFQRIVEEDDEDEYPPYEEAGFDS